MLVLDASLLPCGDSSVPDGTGVVAGEGFSLLPLTLELAEIAGEAFTPGNKVPKVETALLSLGADRFEKMLAFRGSGRASFIDLGCSL